jgi:hypothetical protein
MVGAEGTVSDCVVPVLKADVDDEDADVTGMLAARELVGIFPVFGRKPVILGAVLRAVLRSGVVSVFSVEEEEMVLGWVGAILESVWVEVMSVNVANGEMLPKDVVSSMTVLEGIPVIREDGALDDNVSKILVALGGEDLAFENVVSMEFLFDVV